MDLQDDLDEISTEYDVTVDSLKEEIQLKEEEANEVDILATIGGHDIHMIDHYLRTRFPGHPILKNAVFLRLLEGTV